MYILYHIFYYLSIVFILFFQKFLNQITMENVLNSEERSQFVFVPYLIVTKSDLTAKRILRDIWKETIERKSLKINILF